jgi:acylphosphatase
MERGASLGTLHVTVRGRVQGVGFRYFVRERARAMRLTGWVRNLADGSVEVLAQGDSDALQRFHTTLRQGPPGARVASIDDVAVAPADDPLDPFGIIR